MFILRMIPFYRLTAFVAKSFKQASKYIYVADEVLHKSLLWITRHVNSDGSVQQVGTVHDTLLQVADKYR